MAVAVTCNASERIAGDYLAAALKITCNDALSPSNQVPVSMWVLPAAPIMLPEPAFTMGTSNEVAWDVLTGPVSYLSEVAVDTNATGVQSSGWITSTNHTFTSLVPQILYYHVKASVMSDIGRLEGSWSEWVHSEQVSDNGDLDLDGLPNWWESKYFFSITNAIIATDSDGDGYDNLEEYISGMNPTDPGSYFRIISQETTLDSHFIIHWNAITGRVYGITWSTNLQESFQPLEININYPQNSYTDQVHQLKQGGFYRVNVQLD